MSTPRVGILADDSLQQHLLKQTISHLGYEVALATSPDRFELIRESAVNLDAWLVDVKQESDEECPAWWDDLLGGDVPVLVGLEKAPARESATFPRWQKRLYQKLHELVRTPVRVSETADNLRQLSAVESISVAQGKIPLPHCLQDSSAGLATEVWVLGASLGGPGAVKAFLDALPAGLPVGFVYAQHIDARFEGTLANTVGRHSALRFAGFEAGGKLHNGDVLVAPITNEFEFAPTFEMIDKGQPWPGPYGPSIDQVILNVHQRFPHRMGVMLFSGMGNDGSDAISTIAASEVPVWVQTPGCCASDSMPQSALDTGQVSFHGTPFQLANQLVNRLKNQRVRVHESDTSQD